MAVRMPNRAGEILATSSAQTTRKTSGRPSQRRMRQSATSRRRSAGCRRTLGRRATRPAAPAGRGDPGVLGAPDDPGDPGDPGDRGETGDPGDPADPGDRSSWKERRSPVSIRSEVTNDTAKPI